jgi:polyhydroxyalkanoate synthesis regulator phasin
MRKALATLVIGAVAAVGITVGAATLTPTAATAQEDVVAAEGAGPLEEILGELVTEGVISQDQADAVAERIREAGPFHRAGHRRGAHLETVADLLDMEPAELGEALRDGQSIADLAGDDTQSVIDALVAEATERLDQAVADEKLTQDEADDKLAEITQRITDMVNGERPEDGRGRPGHGPRGGGFFGQQEGATTNA